MPHFFIPLCLNPLCRVHFFNSQRYPVFLFVRIHLVLVCNVYLGTAPWKINFAHFLVTRTIWYALSDSSHKKIQKCLKVLKLEAKVRNFAKFRVLRTFFNYNCPKRYLVKLGKVRDLYHKKALLIS